MVIKNAKYDTKNLELKNTQKLEDICLEETRLFGLRVEIVSVKFLRVVVVIPTSKTVNWILWLGLNVPGKYFKMNF